MVPDGWATDRVGAVLSQMAAGVSVNSTDIPATDGQIGILKTSCVSNGRFDPLKNKAVVEHKEITRVRQSVRAGTTIVSRMNTPVLVGANGYVDTDYPNLFLPDRLWSVKPVQTVDGRWLGYWFASPHTRYALSALGTGTSGSMKNITKEDVRSLPITLPPLPEQQKIAEILSTWDKAIETTEKLLANAEGQKRALMQQLLAGKRRLKGLERQKWRYFKIADIAREVSQRNGDNGDLPVVSCSKSLGFVSSLEYFNKQVFSDDRSGYKLIRRGQLGYPSNHIEEGSIGLQNLYEAAVVSPIYTVFEVNTLASELFLFRLLKTDRYRQMFAAATNASVDRRGSLRWKAFSQLPIYLPPLAEQAAINGVLDVSEALVRHTRSALEKILAEKRVLMQQLLTGKRRVKT